MRRILLTACISLYVLASVLLGYDRDAWASSSQPATWHVIVTSRPGLRLSHPEGLAIDQRGHSVNKWMYLVDTGNDRIVKLGTGGRYLGGWGARGAGAGQFEQPTGIAVDRFGDVYVVDTGNNRIQKFGPTGHFLLQWGMKGTGAGDFSTPTAIAAGGSGNVFVADRDNARIQKFSPAGRLLASWPVSSWGGLSTPSGSGQPGLGTAGPIALTVDARGNVYSAVDLGQCSGGHCVMDYIALETYSPSGKLLHSVVGGNPYGPYVPGGAADAGPWWQIGALAVDPHGHLFVTEWNPSDRASVTELTSRGTRIGQWELPKPSGPGARVPQGIALASGGSVYVTDTFANRVLRLTIQS